MFVSRERRAKGGDADESPEKSLPTRKSSSSKAASFSVHHQIRINGARCFSNRNDLTENNLLENPPCGVEIYYVQYSTIEFLSSAALRTYLDVSLVLDRTSKLCPGE